MKIPIDWLKEFVDFNDTPEGLAKKLTLVGLEVEGIEDGVLDIEVTPNRGDLLSIKGVAREIAAINDSKFEIRNSKFEIYDSDLPLTAETLNSEVSPIYLWRIITGFKISDSPIYIKKRLNQCGIRDLTSVIDITNYVMLETGQPLHAFDYDSITGHLMSIRRGKEGERVKTLDGGVHDVDSDVIIIADEKNLIDLAGIMGGLLSEFKQDTKTIVLQSAIFDPILIRRASKKLQVKTEASTRYERGADWLNAKNALDRATELILNIAGGKAGKIQYIENQKYEPNIIDFKPKQISKFLGINISDDQIKNILKKLGFEIKNNSICVPSWRKADCSIWQDLSEEVGRYKNYNSFPIKIPKKEKQKSQDINFTVEQIIKDKLTDIGFQEVYSYSYYSKKDLQILDFDTKKLARIANPISKDTKYLRPDLVVSLLCQIQKNPWSDNLKIFEIGHVFPDSQDEKIQIGIAYTGKSEKFLESIIKNLASKIEISKENLIYEIIKIPVQVLQYYKIRREVTIALLDFDSITKNIKSIKKDYSLKISKTKYKKISKYPPVSRDIAFILDKNINSNQVLNQIKKVSEKILIVELFDEFESHKFGKGKKNLAFHIILQDIKKTLETKEIEGITKKIIDQISTQYKAKIRDF